MEKRIDYLYHEILKTTEMQFAPIRQELETLFRKSRVENTSLNYHWNFRKEEEVQQCTFSFPLKGSYESLRKFLESIEKSEFMLIIDRINLAESTETGKELNLQISISTYFYEPKIPKAKKRS
jgi:hypothetical protein